MAEGTAAPGATPEHDPLAATHEGTQAHSEKSGGLPQLKLETFPGQLFWLVVTFVLLYVAMAAFALPRLKKVMEDRAGRIKSDLDEAAKAQAAAVEAGKAHEASLADARARARKLSDEARASVQAQVDAKFKAEGERLASDVGRAEQRIQAMRTQALSNVRGIAIEAAGSLVEKLGGQAAGADTLAHSVDAALKRG
jgi:F-type H+-transporting ATPase subunit b